jgi:hypothetical protein
MKKLPALLLSALTLALSLPGCNFPGSGEQISPPADAQTSIALTVEAHLLSIPSPAAVTERAILPSPSATTTPLNAPTATITPTYSVPMLRLLENTNCRSGPGTEYPIIHTYLIWKELEIIGAYPQLNYWLVKSPESPSGECWLWGGHVEIKGSYWSVPSVTPPPTVTPAPPAAPALQEWTFNCNVGLMTVSIRWTDRAADESGYRIIRNDQSVAELPAGSNTYTETIPYASGDRFVYFVEVYNPNGFTRSTAIQFTCP